MRVLLPAPRRENASRGSLRRTVCEFIEHYHHERNHQGLGNQVILSVEDSTRSVGRIVSRERFDGLLKYYHRAAA